MFAFRPNCPTPPDHTGYVFSPNIRGTIDVLWNSFFTAALCIRAVQRLNVPPQEPQPATWAQKLARKLDPPKLKWMFITLLAPEFLLGKAVVERLSAKCSYEKIRHWAEIDGVDWSVAHSYLANMGGFVIQFEENTALAEGTNDTESGPESGRNYKLAEKAILDLTTKASAQSRNTPQICRNISRLRGNTWVLDAPQLLLARELGIIATLPSLPLRELQGQSKPDWVIESYTAGRVIWLASELLARLAKQLPTPFLEVIILAFGACAFATYALVWDKPRDIRTPRCIVADRLPSGAWELARLGEEGPAEFFLGRGLSASGGGSRLVGVESAAHGRDGEAGGMLALWAGVTGLVGMVAGLFHFLGLFFEFPAEGDRRLWLGAAVVMTVAPGLAAGGGYGLRRLLGWYCSGGVGSKGRITYEWRQGRERLIDWLVHLVAVLFLLARLYVVVEVLVLLGYLRSEAFLNGWSL
ncbi:MAG: hypothetical protein M1839_004556 [Geoglossum umbratile]|nr:MAG: hypothetical protein M1839_004556 [Geoglossum umbratile]